MISTDGDIEQRGGRKGRITAAAVVSGVLILGGIGATQRSQRSEAEHVAEEKQLGNLMGQIGDVFKRKPARHHPPRTHQAWRRCRHRIPPSRPRRHLRPRAPRLFPMRRDVNLPEVEILHQAAAQRVLAQQRGRGQILSRCQSDASHIHHGGFQSRRYQVHASWNLL